MKTDKTKAKTMPTKTVVMDLLGIDGNAFSIIGAFRRNARRQGWTEDEIKAVTDEATSGDYDYLLQTFIGYTSPQ